jgi:hypothetical protein
MGASIYGRDLDSVVCQLNSATAKGILQSLNPGLHFEKADVDRVFVQAAGDAAEIISVVDRAFSEHEAAREPSVEFRRPGFSPWRAAQTWAQLAVDREHGARLQKYEPERDIQRPKRAYRLRSV